jgi:serine protease Do
MKQILVLLVVTSILFSSCASILNGKYQKININKKAGDEILINGEPAQMKKGKYLFGRDLKPKQITIKSDNYKDENIVIMQYKKSPLYIMSWIPFGILLYPPLHDRGVKSWNYDNEIISYQKTPTIKQRPEEAKRIKVNSVSIDLDKSSAKNRYFPTYRNYLRKDSKKKAVSTDMKEEIKIENTIFSLVLNDLLAEKGYIDTTGSVLKDSYLGNLLLNATIKDYTIHHIANRYYTRFGGMVYVDIEIEWEVLDYYKKPIYTQITKSKSGQFAIQDYEKINKVIAESMKDVMEGSLIEFLSTEKVDFLLHDKSELAKEKVFDEILIARNSNKVSNLSETVKSTLTVKTKKGFGSGFLISGDGYIITNYHVVSDPKDLKVVLNDKSEYGAEIVRVSKIYDLALLKIKASNLLSFSFSLSEEIPIASEIYAIGTPTAEDLSQTISRGIVSGIRTVDNYKLIQTDASINSGNSGGPIVNKNGEVVGVVSSKLKGFGVEGVAFGIPATEIFDKLNIKIQ